jgi:hypothetical protein
MIFPDRNVSLTNRALLQKSFGSQLTRNRFKRQIRLCWLQYAISLCGGRYWLLLVTAVRVKPDSYSLFDDALVEHVK